MALKRNVVLGIIVGYLFVLCSLHDVLEYLVTAVENENNEILNALDKAFDETYSFYLILVNIPVLGNWVKSGLPMRPSEWILQEGSDFSLNHLLEKYADLNYHTDVSYSRVLLPWVSWIQFVCQVLGVGLIIASLVGVVASLVSQCNRMQLNLKVNVKVGQKEGKEEEGNYSPEQEVEDMDQNVKTSQMDEEVKIKKLEQKPMEKKRQVAYLVLACVLLESGVFFISEHLMARLFTAELEVLR